MMIASRNRLASWECRVARCWPAGWVGAACLLAISGCAIVERDQRAVALQAATNGYQAAIRWGYHETAIGFLAPERRQDPSLTSVFENIRITGYDVLQPPVIQGDDTAIQIVRIDYLNEDTQVVKSLTDRQLWRWDDRQGIWSLASGLPPLGSRPSVSGPGRSAMGR
jgi:hypothetical protein